MDKKIKRIVTLHDIIFLKKEIPLPYNTRQLLGKIYYSLCTILNIYKVNTIFTVSEFSKNDITKMFHINDNKFVLTQNGHEHYNIEVSANFCELKEKYGIPDKYFFSLGGETPSKNTEILAKIFAKNPNINLVISGIKNPKNNPMAKKYYDYKNIIFVPYISQKELVGIYKNALAFIFPSIYEGFGIPLLEAMKCGCPVLSSNASCLPEVAGDAALFFNPKNELEINEKIKLIIQNSDLRQELISKGFDRLKVFSWRKTAEIVLRTYKLITGELNGKTQ